MARKMWANAKEMNALTSKGMLVYFLMCYLYGGGSARRVRFTESGLRHNLEMAARHSWSGSLSDGIAELVGLGYIVPITGSRFYNVDAELWKKKGKRIHMTDAEFEKFISKKVHGRLPQMEYFITMVMTFDWAKKYEVGGKLGIAGRMPIKYFKRVGGKNTEQIKALNKSLEDDGLMYFVRDDKGKVIAYGRPCDKELVDGYAKRFCG